LMDLFLLALHTPTLHSAICINDGAQEWRGDKRCLKSVVQTKID
jgi:hypothetical protein